MLWETDQLIIVLRVFLAFVAGVIVGFDREKSGKAAGIRTQMLVCVGSALLSGVSVYLGPLYGIPQAEPARLMAQIIVGIGFLGAGVILKSQGKIIGLTTAATIWVTASIGIALGAGFYLAALATLLFVLLLNPMAELQYKYGLKGDEYCLEVNKNKRKVVAKILKRLVFRVKEEKIDKNKICFLIITSEHRNDILSKQLSKLKIGYKLEKETGE